MRLILAAIGTDPTVTYAVEELLRCLRAMDRTIEIDRRIYDAADPSVGGVLFVGPDGSVKESVDDAIRIDVKNGAGIITGSSPRAVLIAAYRFLFELGCRFLRPGDDGELIPQLSLTPERLSVSVSEEASYRHRAICIEGGVSYEHVYNMINWLPKVGLNGYFMQHFNPVHFFNRWYGHVSNPFRGSEEIDREEAAHMWRQIEAEIKKRGLMYHAVGHGWTCEPFGVPGLASNVPPPPVTPELEPYLAMINGKRAFFGNGTFYTNLCYSNPVVRKTMIDSVVDYCKKNPTVGYLHFWLADSLNSHCECENCRKMTPSDFYVQMLNELDARMTEAGLDTKVVFLLYLDLIWAPEKLRIENPDRFVLMFAPITRTYYKEFADFDRSQKFELTPYVRNKLTLPSSVSENVARLEAWQAQFDGDSFDFDYHLMWHHHKDPGYCQVSRVLHNDMVNLGKIGLDGMVSCQIQRAAFPTGLPMYAMAKALWNKNSVYEDVSGEYFAAAFGKDGGTVEAYLEALSGLLSKNTGDDLRARAEAAKTLVERFREDHLPALDGDAASRHYLARHADITLRYIDLLLDPDDMPAEEHNAKVDDMQRYLFSLEPELHSVLDTAQLFGTIFKKLLRK